MNEINNADAPVLNSANPSVGLGVDAPTVGGAANLGIMLFIADFLMNRAQSLLMGREMSDPTK